MMEPSEAEQLLLTRFSQGSIHAVSRLSCEVAAEQVTIRTRTGRLDAVCTCGVPRCEHYVTALQWLVGEEVTLHQPVPLPDPHIRSSVRAPLPAGPDLGALADAFDALLLAVVRSGVAAAGSPSVRNAMDGLGARAPTPMPLGLSRWLGRLHEALQRADVGETARVLEGARVFADELRASYVTPEVAARRNAWLAPAVFAQRTVVPLEAATLLEVGREWLSGIERGAIERRYLLDLGQGEVVREERARADTDISVGPCPRVLEVAFGEVESFGAPRRVQLLQYTVSARPSAQHWARSEPFSKQLVRHVAEAYETAVRPCPALAEPFMLVSPRRVDLSGRPAWVDSEGQRMLLSEEAGQPITELLQQYVDRGRIVWIAGRLVGLAQGLVLRPTSVLLARADGPHLMRVA